MSSSNPYSNSGGAWFDPPSAGAGDQPQWSQGAAAPAPQQPNQPQPSWVDPAGSAPPAYASPGGSANRIPTVTAQKRELDTWRCWTSEFYQQFFDVDTDDVLRRLGNVLLPLVPPDFLHDRHWHMGGTGPSGAGAGGAMPQGIASAAAAYGGNSEKRADLYGPLWVSTTLWVLLAVVGNVMGKMAYNRRLNDYNINVQKMLNASVPGLHQFTPPPPAKWVYDFKAASVGATVVYFYIVFMALLVWGLMKWKNVPVGFTDTVALYGYSMFVWILGGILCAVPQWAFQWLVCALAATWSAAYLLLNFWTLWKVTLEKPWFMGLVILVLGTQVALAFGFKLYFFDYQF